MGPDVGGACRTVTITCSTCKKLRDAVVSTAPWDGDAVADEPVCPGSRTRMHKVRLWDAPGACPRCGARMLRDEERIILWD